MEGTSRKTRGRRMSSPREEVAAADETVVEAPQQVDLGQVMRIIQDALGPLVEKVQSVERQLEIRAAGPGEVEGGCHLGARDVRQVVELLPAQEKLSFKGGSQNPISFLEDHREYTRKTRRTDKLMVTRESLKGEAKSWIKIYWSRWKSIKDLEGDFLAN